MNRLEQLKYKTEIAQAVEQIPLLELKSLEEIAVELNFLGYTSPRGKKLTKMTVYRAISKKRRTQSQNNSDF